MHVLVTGATGFVGSHAVEALLDAGHRVTAMVRDPVRLDTALTPGHRARVGTVIGDMLQSRGSGPVFPFALATRATSD